MWAHKNNLGKKTKKKFNGSQPGKKIITSLTIEKI